MKDRLHDEFNRLKMEHMADRDGRNNYSCFNVEGCRDCNFVYDSVNCFSCHKCDQCIECTQCVNCRNCAFCVGLTDAQFQILNVQYTEEEYNAKLKELGYEIDMNGGF